MKWWIAICAVVMGVGGAWQLVVRTLEFDTIYGLYLRPQPDMFL